MLTRPDAGPGCSWMKRMHERVPGPSVTPVQPNPRIRWFWGFFSFLILFLVLVQLTRRWSSVVNMDGVREYQSPVRIAGLPVIAMGAHPNGVVAIGGRPTGFIAIGGIAVGVVAIGGLAFGGIALGGLSAAIFALGGGALGWWAVGGGAVGRYALGGLAFGDYAYAGNGVAYGYHEASGRQKEKLLE
jgi:hypothetical protein